MLCIFFVYVKMDTPLPLGTFAKYSYRNLVRNEQSLTDLSQVSRGGLRVILCVDETCFAEINKVDIQRKH